MAFRGRGPPGAESPVGPPGAEPRYQSLARPPAIFASDKPSSFFSFPSLVRRLVMFYCVLGVGAFWCVCVVQSSLDLFGFFLWLSLVLFVWWCMIEFGSFRWVFFVLSFCGSEGWCFFFKYDKEFVLYIFIDEKLLYCFLYWF